MKMLTVECPECDHEWKVAEESLEQPPRGAALTIQCPACKRQYNVAGLRAHGFVYSEAEEAAE